MLLTLSMGVGFAFAQAAPDEHLVKRPGATGLLEVPPEQLPPQLRLGRRVEQVRRNCQVIPIVVIVRDSKSYIEAIARWTPTLRYPVLIDDGSHAAREDIARFVRGFAPKRVVRWTHGTPTDAPDFAQGKDGGKGDVTTTESALTSALARSWSWNPNAPAPANGEAQSAALYLNDLWKRVLPPGVVVTRADDPAWTAALAIAAFRGEPLVFPTLKDSPGTMMTFFTPAQVDAMASEIEGACEVLARDAGLRWKELGDDLDAITLCLHKPVKIQVAPDLVVATTDRLGRSGTTTESGTRWAWAGQIFGQPAQAAYRAMGALFLSQSNAWLFDGYSPTDKNFAVYDCTPAEAVLKMTGLTTVLDDAPKSGSRDWRDRVAHALDANLVFVTTMGNKDFFDVNTGTLRPGDLPMLRTPAAVHFTHSWSAQWPSDRETIAGRWLERGAYSYIGSVDEPFLQAFVPTVGLAQRFVTGGPWGLVARMDGGQFSKPWKVAVFGDPLMVFGDPMKSADPELPITATTDLLTTASASLKEGRYVEGACDLIMLGRDEPVCRLVAAMRAEKSMGLSPELIAASIEPLFRCGRYHEMVDLYSLLPEGSASNPVLRDALWLASPTLLAGRAEQSVLEVYRKNLREDLIERDATELARGWSLSSSRGEALQMLQELRPRFTDPAQKAALERAIAAYRSR